MLSFPCGAHATQGLRAAEASLSLVAWSTSYLKMRDSLALNSIHLGKWQISKPHKNYVFICLFLFLSLSFPAPSSLASNTSQVCTTFLSPLCNRFQVKELAHLGNEKDGLFTK